MKRSIGLVLLFFSLTSICHSYDITTNVLQRVLFMKYGGGVGTCFTIDVDNKQYIVTAAHNVKGIKSNGIIDLMRERQWVPIPVKVIRIKPDAADIIVLVPEIQLTVSYELEPSMENMVAGQQMYFLGYPFGLSMNDENALKINNGMPIPLIKNGILSGLFTTEKPNQYTILILDGLNNEGFSGGPIVFKDQKANKLKVCGVIVSYRWQEIPVCRKVPLKEPDPKTGMKYKLVDTDMVAKSNTGIAFGCGINVAMEAIRKNPIGPMIKQ